MSIESIAEEIFQSTPSVGRATFTLTALTLPNAISIHALRGEGDDGFKRCDICIFISIHALRGEGDSIIQTKHNCFFCISIHALRGEGDDIYSYLKAFAAVNFNPRPPWGGRLFLFM